MSHTDSDDSDQEPQARPVFVRSSDLSKTQGQVSALLMVLDKSSELLASTLDSGVVFEVEPESKDEAKKTYALAHHTLRNLLLDVPRWSSEDRRVDRVARSTLVAARKLAEAQRDQIIDAMRPSVRLHPRVRRFTQGWICWLGEGLPDASTLLGMGESPDEAMTAFDKAFFVRAKIQSEERREAVQEVLAPKAPPKKKRKKPTATPPTTQ